MNLWSRFFIARVLLMSHHTMCDFGAVFPFIVLDYFSLGEESSQCARVCSVKIFDQTCTAARARNDWWEHISAFVAGLLKSAG